MRSSGIHKTYKDDDRQNPIEIFHMSEMFYLQLLITAFSQIDYFLKNQTFWVASNMCLPTKKPLLYIKKTSGIKDVVSENFCFKINCFNVIHAYEYEHGILHNPCTF